MTAVAVSTRAIVGIAFGSFVVLALPKSAFGVAWPSAAADFDQGLGALGLVIAVHTSGYMASSVVTGPVMARLGAGASFFAASVAATVGLAGYAFVAHWYGFLVAAFALGAGGGLMDAGVNAHLAVRHGARIMNLLHASFGVGATLGPILMTGFLAAGGSWTSAYLLLAAIQAGLSLMLWTIRASWDDRPRAAPDPTPPTAGESSRPDQTSLLWIMLASFFFYAGLEVGAGQWSFSVLTESRGMGESAAGIVVAAYWASFTAGRFVAGAVGDRVRAEAVIRMAGLVAVTATAVFWWSPSPWIGAAALAILGAALAGVFPAMILLTARRVGAAATGHVVGYELAAASVGVGVIPGAAGLFVAWFGLDAVAPLLFATAVAVLALTEWSRAVAGRARVGT